MTDSEFAEHQARIEHHRQEITNLKAGLANYDWTYRMSPELAVRFDAVGRRLHASVAPPAPQTTPQPERPWRPSPDDYAWHWFFEDCERHRARQHQA